MSEKMPRIGKKIEQEFAKVVLAKAGDLITIEELDENRERTEKYFQEN